MIQQSNDSTITSGLALADWRRGEDQQRLSQVNSFIFGNFLRIFLSHNCLCLFYYLYLFSGCVIQFLTRIYLGYFTFFLTHSTATLFLHRRHLATTGIIAHFTRVFTSIFSLSHFHQTKLYTFTIRSLIISAFLSHLMSLILTILFSVPQILTVRTWTCRHLSGNG